MKTIITILALFANGFINAQSLMWSKQIPSGSIGSGIVTAFNIGNDMSGNVFTTGWFSGTVDFDPGPGTHTLSSTGPSAFVCKLDMNGNFLWTASVESSGTNGGNSNGKYALKTDVSGNIYVHGFFSGTCDFDPGQGVYNLTAANNNFPFISFLWKLDAAGNFLWVKQIPDLQNIFSLSIDASGNLLTAGTFTGTVDFDLGAGIHTLTSIGSQDGFICKINPSGNLTYVQQIGGTNAKCELLSVSTDSNSDVHAICNFSGTIDADPGVGTHVLSHNGYQNFSLKLDAAGIFQAAFTIDGPSGTATITKMQHDALGNLFVIGQYTGTCDFDPSASVYTMQANPSGAFASKFGTTGNFLWSKSIDAATSTTDIQSDGGANVFLTGVFSGTIDADPGQAIYPLTAQSNHFFLSSLNSSGNFVSAISFSKLDKMSIGNNGSIHILLAQGMGMSINKYASVYTNLSDNQKSELELSLFPNPGNGFFTLNQAFQAELSVEIYNSAGQNVYSQIMVGGSLPIDLQNCEAGVYLIRVLGKENTVWQKKLIKQ